MTFQKGNQERKGCIPWNKGTKGLYNEEYRKKLSDAKKGKPGPWAGKKRVFSDEHKENLSKGKMGYKFSEESKRKIGFGNSGSKNGNWKGGIWLFADPLNTPEFTEWRKQVFKRDNYTCKICNQGSRYLNAHHIFPRRDMPLLVYDPENGITLCIDCHRKTFGKEHEYIETFLKHTMEAVNHDSNRVDQ